MYPRLVDRVESAYGPGTDSLPAALSWIATGHTARQVMCGVAVLALVALAVRLRRGPDGDLRVFAILIGVSVVATPMVWPHYVAVLLVPLAIARPRVDAAWFLPYALWPILAIDDRVLRAWMFLLLALAVMAVPLVSRSRRRQRLRPLLADRPGPFVPPPRDIDRSIAIVARWLNSASAFRWSNRRISPSGLRRGVPGFPGLDAPGNPRRLLHRCPAHAAGRVVRPGGVRLQGHDLGVARATIDWALDVPGADAGGDGARQPGRVSALCAAARATAGTPSRRGGSDCMDGSLLSAWRGRCGFWACATVGAIWSLLVSVPVMQGLLVGNLTLLLLLPLALAWRYRDHAVVAGVAVGVGVAAKLFVWPLIVWLLITRRFVAAAWSVATAASPHPRSVGLVGFDGILQYPALLAALQDHFAPRSFSLATLAASLGVSAPGGVVLCGAAGVALLALAWWLVRASGRRTGGPSRSWWSRALLLRRSCGPFMLRCSSCRSP